MEKEIDDAELKNISVEGLKFLKRICEAENIKYYLAYGTLIGTIRPKGFIPWDDDIDVWMLREDYERFIKAVEKQADASWEILSYKTNSNYYFTFAKLCNKNSIIYPSRFYSGLMYGISVDIFPLDYCVSDNIEAAKIEMNKIKDEYLKWETKVKPYTGGLNYLKKDLKKYLRKTNFYVMKKLVGNHTEILKRLESELEKNTEDNAKYLMCPFSPVSCIIDKEDLQGEVKNDFEGDTYSIPSGYDNILRNIYGDYMKLPPEEKRVSHHSFIAYYK